MQGPGLLVRCAAGPGPGGAHCSVFEAVGEDQVGNEGVTVADHRFVDFGCIRCRPFRIGVGIPGASIARVRQRLARDRCGRELSPCAVERIAGRAHRQAGFFGRYVAADGQAIELVAEDPGRRETRQAEALHVVFRRPDLVVIAKPDGATVEKIQRFGFAFLDGRVVACLVDHEEPGRVELIGVRVEVDAVVDGRHGRRIGSVARVQNGQLESRVGVHVLQLRNVAGLFGSTGGVCRTHLGCVVGDLAVTHEFAGGGAAAAPCGRCGGPAAATVERAADVELVAIAAAGVAFPVRRPGVHDDGHVAPQVAAVSLGHVQRVVPGLVVEVAAHRRGFGKRAALRRTRALNPEFHLVEYELVGRIATGDAGFVYGRTDPVAGVVVAAAAGSACLGRGARDIDRRTHADAVWIVGIGAVAEQRFLADQVGEIIRVGRCTGIDDASCHDVGRAALLKQTLLEQRHRYQLAAVADVDQRLDQQAAAPRDFGPVNVVVVVGAAAVADEVPHVDGVHGRVEIAGAPVGLGLVEQVALADQVLDQARIAQVRTGLGAAHLEREVPDVLALVGDFAVGIALGARRGFLDVGFAYPEEELVLVLECRARDFGARFKEEATKALAFFSDDDDPSADGFVEFIRSGQQADSGPRGGGVGDVWQPVLADADRGRLIVLAGRNLDRIGALILQSVGRCRGIFAEQQFSYAGTAARAAGIVGDSHRHGERDIGFRLGGVGGPVVGERLRVTVDVEDGFEVCVRQERVPDVGLAVADGAAPAFAGAFSSAGTQSAGIFLPDHGSPGARHHCDFNPIDVATARGQTFRLVPDHVIGFEHAVGPGIVTFEENAAGGPEAVERHLADGGEALLGVVDRSLGAGNAEQVGQVQVGGPIDAEERGHFIQVPNVVGVGIGRVGGRPRRAEPARPRYGNVITGYGVGDIYHIPGIVG